MRLCDALGVGRKGVVTFVGGGGKTTAMFRLARELVGSGRRVVATTTTRIFAEQMRLAPKVIIGKECREILSRLPKVLQDHGWALVVGGVLEKGDHGVRNAEGVRPEVVASMLSLPEVDAVVVEGDGSRHRPLKAPAQHEPVVPEATTLLVPVVGIDVIGRPLTDDFVHRAEQVAKLSGVKVGETVSPQIVAQTLTSSMGGRKGRPALARCSVLINKVETAEELRMAEDLARRILDTGTIECVCAGSVARPESSIRVFAA